MVVRRPWKILPDAGRSAPVRTPGPEHGGNVGNGSTGHGLCGNDNGSVRGGAKMETINMERAYDRLDELKEFLANFPESELVPAVKNEIRYLEKEIEANLP